MENNLDIANRSSLRSDEIESDHIVSLENPASQRPGKQASGQSNDTKAPVGVYPKVARAKSLSTKNQLNARAIAPQTGSIAGTAPAANTGVDKPSIGSSDQAVLDAKKQIDADLANAWSEQVKDVREWIQKNKGNYGYEALNRLLCADSEAYLLLAQAAKRKKDYIDALAKESGADSKTLPQAIDSQARQFSALTDRTLNKMRVGTDKTPERAPVRDKRDADDGSNTDAQIQTEIDKTADQIQHSSAIAAEAEHAADASGMPTINNHRERELAYCKEMAVAAKALSGQLENLSTGATTLEAFGKEFNIPGKALTKLGAGGLLSIGPSAYSLYKQISEYSKKSPVTKEDREKLGQATMHFISAVAPYVPVIGPLIAPLITIADFTYDMIMENKATPVENVASEMKSQTLKKLLGGYSPINPPTTT